MKKYTITNKPARKILEDSYHIRRLMRDSFRKSNTESKPDFTKSVLKQLDVEDKNELGFNPIITVAFAFVISVLLISAVVIYMLSMN